MRRILVVDDEPAYRDSLERLLTAEGHEIRTAGGCDEALQVSADFAPHVLLVDWMLRDATSGLELAASIRRLVPGVSTILMTGYPSASLRRDARDGDVAAFLEKPFDPDELVREIDVLRQPDDA